MRERPWGRRIAPHHMFRAGIFILCWFLIVSPLPAAFWKAVTVEERALTQPRVDPDAGVEVLFRETEIDDSSDETTDYHTYVRLKVFDERGVAALDQIKIPETRDAPVINLVARVIRPDGTIIDVERDQIFTREILRHATRRVRPRVFSPPAIEPGCIVEYQWNERSENSIAGQQLYFQERFPAWVVRFRIKPFNYDQRGYQLQPASFRYQIPDLRADAQGFYTFEQSNVPALREEPWMPPDDMVQSWMVLYFLRRGQKPADFWRDASRSLAQDTAKLTQPSRELEACAETLAATAADESEKLQRLGAFCRDEIKNLTGYSGTHQPDGRRSGSGKQTAAGTLEKREGTAREINLLFLALARAAGFEARLALAADRSQRLFREPLPARFMLPDPVVAVRVSGEWRFFDPGNPHVPTGWLSWKNEDVTALIVDRTQTGFVQTPRAGRSESGIVRRARVVLDDTGTATGAVVIEYRGHAAIAQREELAELAPERLVAQIHHAEAARLPGFEIGDVLVRHLTEPDRPLIVSYPIRVPHYAIATGTRLMFAPAFFQCGAPRDLAARAREHAIYRPYEFNENDVTEWSLPPGFELGEPAPLAAFALPPAVEYRMRLTLSDDDRSLTCGRTVSHGGMLFSRNTYRLLRQAYDQVHRDDGMVVVAERPGS